MKKSFFSLTFTFLSLSPVANAGYVENLKKLSFDQLRSHYDVELENDQIWFKGSILSILDTCMSDSETIRTNEKKVIEVQSDYGDGFEVIGEDYLYKSINTRRVVLDGEDTFYENYTIKTSRMIKIVTMNDENDGELLFEKEFNIPSCLY